MTGPSTFDLTGRHALVTGASRGLGRAIAVSLAAAGADVVVGLRSPDSATEVLDEIRALDRTANPVVLDVRDLAAARTALDDAIARSGPIDVLVNNAGGSLPQPALDITEDAFRSVIDLNVTSTLFISQHLARHMTEHGAGRIINLSSQAGIVALPGEASYCVAKAAVAHLTRCLAIELGRHNITVNSISPTFIRTPGTESALADPVFEHDVIDRIAALHRIGNPEDVTGAVVFLASSAADMITGHDLVIDGGWTIR